VTANAYRAPLNGDEIPSDNAFRPSLLSIAGRVAMVTTKPKPSPKESPDGPANKMIRKSLKYTFLTFRKHCVASI